MLAGPRDRCYGPRPVTEFETSYQHHLVAEQRRAVLSALAREIGEDATVGDVLDAADALGWSDPMGELTLAELAGALLRPSADEAANDDLGSAEDDDEGPDLIAIVDDEPSADEDAAAKKASAKKASAKKKAAKKKAAKKTSAKKTAKKTPAKKTAKKTLAKKKAAKKAAAKKTTSKKSSAKKKASSKKTKTSSKARLRALRAKIDADEPMSLDEAAELLVPIVAKAKETSMQALEELTGIGRRKLRFHIGQLVKHEYLERHGMGRGTHYTVS